MVISCRSDASAARSLSFAYGKWQPYPVGTAMTITVDGNDPERILEQPEGARLFVAIILALTFSSVSAAAFIQMKNTDQTEPGLRDDHQRRRCI